MEPWGYRPTRIRPYHDGDQILVAAVWTRDGGTVALQRDLTAEQVAESVSKDGEDGLLPGDVAGYLQADVQAQEILAMPCSGRPGPPRTNSGGYWWECPRGDRTAGGRVGRGAVRRPDRLARDQ